MKFLYIAFLVSAIASVAMAGPKAKDKTLPVDKDIVAAKKEVAGTKKPVPGTKAQEILKDKEDCDEKAKKAEVVEIKPETISLGGGNTGCSLEDL